MPLKVKDDFHCENIQNIFVLRMSSTIIIINKVLDRRITNYLFSHLFVLLSIEYTTQYYT